MGFLVDRFGGRIVLAVGLGLHGAAFAAIYFVHSYWAMLILYAIAGIGQAVFHPADYAILASRINRSELGRAVSIHTFAGNIGWAIAPPIVLALTALYSWHFAYLVVGLIGIALAVLIYAQPELLGHTTPLRRRAKGNARSPGCVKA
jgi:sugar phosphate permease